MRVFVARKELCNSVLLSWNSELRDTQTNGTHRHMGKTTSNERERSGKQLAAGCPPVIVATAVRVQRRQPRGTAGRKHLFSPRKRPGETTWRLNGLYILSSFAPTSAALCKIGSEFLGTAVPSLRPKIRGSAPRKARCGRAKLRHI